MTAISKHFRWTLAARGVAAILFGVLAWAWPGITLLALLIIFGAYALVDGVLAFVGSLVHRKVFKDWWLVLLLGLASILVGVMTFARPGITALVLLFFIAARALVVGALEIASAIEYRHLIRHEWLLALSGVVSVLFAIAVLAYPVTGALAIIWAIGVYAIIMGVLQLAFALSARPWEVGTTVGEQPRMA
jgi:uncharacterized membrane protein HdeD (DUF308 family)